MNRRANVLFSNKLQRYNIVDFLRLLNVFENQTPSLLFLNGRAHFFCDIHHVNLNTCLHLICQTCMLSALRSYTCIDYHLLNICPTSPSYF